MRRVLGRVRRRRWGELKRARLLLGLELLEPDDGEVLDQALLDLLEPVMVVIELLPRVDEERAVPEFVG